MVIPLAEAVVFYDAQETIFVYARSPELYVEGHIPVLPDNLLNLTAMVLPWLELVLGLCLLTGIWMSGAILMSNGLFMKGIL